MGGYGQFCPVATTSELLCERWVPLIVRELLCGSHRFSEVQRGVPLISPALLPKRLRQLEAAGVIERRDHGHGSDYVLTSRDERNPVAGRQPALVAARGADRAPEALSSGAQFVERLSGR